MSTMVLTPTRGRLRSAHDAACVLASRAATADPIGTLVARRAASTRNGIAPIVVFLVLMVVLMALAAVISIAVLIFCSQKGMNFVWYVKTSWFEVKVACRK